MASDLKYREEHGRMFQKHYSGLFNYGLKISGSPDLTRDAIQDLFIQLWNNRRKFAAVEKPESYLYRSLRNNILRKMKSGDSITRAKFPGKEIEYSHEEFMITEEITLESTRKVSALLNKLPPRQKEIIYLRFYNNLKYQEISEVLDISCKTVKNLAYEALSKMRGLLSP